MLTAVVVLTATTSADYQATDRFVLKTAISVVAAERVDGSRNPMFEFCVLKCISSFNIDFDPSKFAEILNVIGRRLRRPD